jgi:hypothetical protein
LDPFGVLEPLGFSLGPLAFGLFSRSLLLGLLFSGLSFLGLGSF